MEDIQNPHTRFEIQFPHLKQLLKECVPEHANFDLERQAIILEDQPRCVFHYRQKLIDYHDRCSQNNEVDAARHVAMLLNHMFRTFEQEIRQFNRSMESLELRPALAFANLWMAFVPGQIVYAEKKCNHEKLRGCLFRLQKWIGVPAQEPSVQGSLGKLAVILSTTTAPTLATQSLNVQSNHAMG